MRIAFLSGGIDSSTIVALLQASSPRPVKTFTVGFEQAGYNEAEHARRIADYLGTEHTTFQVSANDALAVIPRLPQLYDEPFADTSQIPTFLLCQCARQQVTVALSGDAGDELFGGYSTYLWATRLWNKLGYLPFPLRKLLSAAMCSIPVQSWNQLAGGHSQRTGENLHKLANGMRHSHQLEDFFLSLSSHWQSPEQLVVGVQPQPAWQANWLSSAGTEAEHAMMLQDSLTELPDDILCKIDRAAMGNSLETRIPMLDHRVVELAWRLPLSMKIRDGQGKWILRQLLYQHVPAELVDRPKQGFNVPLADWLRGDLRAWAEAQLDSTRLQREGYLHAPLVRRHWQDFLAGRGHHAQPLWNVLMFQAWLEHWQHPA
ncbi:MAG: asparagine synthase C-terminal domain-containing protein [Thiolinea sp.]